jgi:hypothetical protein
MIVRWARFPTPGVGFRADPLIMAPDQAVVALYESRAQSVFAPKP